jgi:hypothetical protein
MRSLTLSLLIVPLVIGCASGGTGTQAGSSRDLISAADLADMTEITTMEAIRRLRPNWLRSRNAPTPAGFESGGTEPALRVDGVMAPDLSQLNYMPARDVQEIRFLSASDATTLYGTGYVNGIIQVRTKGD